MRSAWHALVLVIGTLSAMTSFSAETALESLDDERGKVSALLDRATVPPILKLADNQPGAIFSGVSVIATRLSLKWNGQSVFVPRDALAMLVDPKSVKIVATGVSVARLVVRGGDGGTAYEATLAFDKTRVRKVEVRTFGVKQPIQETIFRTQMLE